MKLYAYRSPDRIGPVDFGGRDFVVVDLHSVHKGTLKLDKGPEDLMYCLEYVQDLDPKKWTWSFDRVSVDGFEWVHGRRPYPPGNGELAEPVSWLQLLVLTGTAKSKFEQILTHTYKVLQHGPPLLGDLQLGVHQIV